MQAQAVQSLLCRKSVRTETAEQPLKALPNMDNLFCQQPHWCNFITHRFDVVRSHLAVVNVKVVLYTLTYTPMHVIDW